MRQFSTPMMQQYAQIKEQYQDCLLFFRLGDFYELFLDDALIGARVLGITLTKRPRGKDGDIPMAGVPYHAADGYINKLLRAQYKIAICEQVSEPDKKGIVDRAVVRIITPGTILDEMALPDKEHNFIASIALTAKNIGLAVADLSTGLFKVTQWKRTDDDQTILRRELQKLSPRECIVSPTVYNDPEQLGFLTNCSDCFFAPFEEWASNSKHAREQLTNHFKLASLQVVGLEKKSQAIEAAATLLAYLEHTQQQPVNHLSQPEWFAATDCLLLDTSTVTNLELFSTIRKNEKDGSVLGVIDHTVTAAGGRLLRSWLTEPLQNKGMIEQRLAAVDELLGLQLQREKLRDQLSNLYDIERQLSKLSLKLATPAAVMNIAQSLQLFTDLKDATKQLSADYWQELQQISTKSVNQLLQTIHHFLEETETEDTAAVYIIRTGVNEELDSLRQTKTNATTWLAEFEIQERKRTGISSLKCKFNSVFGYYIEVSNSNLEAVPEDYTRKQTLVNAERFITPELKRQEEIILTAAERIEQLEQEIFEDLIAEVVAETNLLKEIAYQLAKLDVILSLAQVAQERQYCKPTINNSSNLQIKAGRHPVVEDLVAEKFVPNDVSLIGNNPQLMLITGPNMAGKSVVMRQVAVLVLLAHIGSFVPAASADIPLTDRIFVRSGASDSISDGLSTFMVEMVEAAYILNHATKNSLVIMDEIGRGTSTYDGISIAWAIVEYLLSKKSGQPKVLFATHYHELQALADHYPEQVQNYQVAVDQHKGRPLFLYTLIPGKSSHSFGVAVAQLAGVPKEVVTTAQAKLAQLEKQHSKDGKSGILQKESNQTVETQSANPLVKALQQFDTNSSTPLEALQLIAQLQDQINKDVKD